MGQKIEDLLDDDVSFAEQNAKRLGRVRQAFAQKDFAVIVESVDLLIAPIEVLVNTLMARSSLLKRLRYRKVGEHDPDAMAERAKSGFHDWVSGLLGQRVVEDFFVQLQSSELAALCVRSSSAGDGTSGQSDTLCRLSETCFRLAVFGASDIWRRFCLPVQTFPWVIFSLESVSPQEFVAKWAEFRNLLETCSTCVDAGFGEPLLRSVDFSTMTSEQEKAIAVRDLRRLLRHIMQSCPLATNTVENLHAQHQSLLSAFRAKRKSPQTAAEQSVLHSLRVEHAYIKDMVDSLTLPTKHKLAQTFRNLGRKRGKLRHSDLRKRLAAAGSRKVRKLGGWNVFQRDMMKKLGNEKMLLKQEWRDAVKDIGQKWRILTLEEKQVFEHRAKYEQSCREQLADRPLRHGPRNKETSVPQETIGEHLPTAQLAGIAGALPSEATSSGEVGH